MFSFPALKLGAQLVAGLGVSKVVSDIIRNNVTVLTPADLLKVRVGGLVIGSMVVEQASNHIARTADELVAWVEKKRTTETTESTV